MVSLVLSRWSVIIWVVDVRSGVSVVDISRWSSGVSAVNSRWSSGVSAVDSKDPYNKTVDVIISSSR